MKEAVRNAIEELRAVYPSTVVEEIGDGGAYVTIPDFNYGDGWEPAEAQLSVTVHYNYPDSQVYPFFGPAELKRTQSAGYPQGVTQQSWRGKPATQISVVQRGGWDPNFHTLLLAIQSVHNYLERYK